MPKHSSKEDAGKGQSLNSLPKRLTRLRRCSRKTSCPPVAEANPSHGSPDNTDPEKPVRVPRKEAEPNPTSPVGVGKGGVGCKIVSSRVGLYGSAGECGGPVILVS